MHHLQGKEDSLRWLPGSYNNQEQLTVLVILYWLRSHSDSICFLLYWAHGLGCWPHPWGPLPFHYLASPRGSASGRQQEREVGVFLPCSLPAFSPPLWQMCLHSLGLYWILATLLPSSPADLGWWQLPTIACLWGCNTRVSFLSPTHISASPPWLPEVGFVSCQVPN